MSHLVIHKIDKGKVNTSKNVMKLLKLLLTVIVKHPVFRFKLFRSQPASSSSTIVDDRVKCPITKRMDGRKEIGEKKANVLGKRKKTEYKLIIKMKTLQRGGWLEGTKPLEIFCKRYI